MQLTTKTTSVVYHRFAAPEFDTCSMAADDYRMSGH